MVANPVHAIPPRKGAAVEWWMHQVCRKLHAHERHIVCIAEAGYATQERIDDVQFHRVRIGRLYKRLFQKITRLDPYSYSRRVAAILRRIRPDIVHVHNAPRLYTALRERLGPPATYVLHMHNEVDFDPLPSGASLFVVSQYLRDWYRTRHPLTDVRTVTNGVDVALFQSPAPTSDPRLDQIPNDRRVLLYVGRMSPEKGPLDLVHAFARLLERRSDVFLVLVGELRQGAASDNRARYGAELAAACAKIRDHCLLAGNVDPAHIQHYYRRGDLLVVPSEFQEPFCMVAIEGMAAQVPVLAARKGGIPEYVHEDKTGFLIPDTKDRDAFANKMSALLDNPALLRSVSDNALAYVAAHHSWDDVSRQLLEAYRTLRRATSTHSEQ
jgi:glycosyltransferase involved in cell wall biosynthesis